MLFVGFKVFELSKKALTRTVNKPMLDPNLLRTDIETVAQKLKVKGHHFDSDAYLALEAERKSLQVAAEEMQALRKLRST